MLLFSIKYLLIDRPAEFFELFLGENNIRSQPTGDIILGARHASIAHGILVNMSQDRSEDRGLLFVVGIFALFGITGDKSRQIERGPVQVPIAADLAMARPVILDDLK